MPDTSAAKMSFANAASPQGATEKARAEIHKWATRYISWKDDRKVLAKGKDSVRVPKPDSKDLPEAKAKRPVILEYVGDLEYDLRNARSRWKVIQAAL